MDTVKNFVGGFVMNTLVASLVVWGWSLELNSLWGSPVYALLMAMLLFTSIFVVVNILVVLFSVVVSAIGAAVTDKDASIGACCGLIFGLLFICTPLEVWFLTNAHSWGQLGTIFPEFPFWGALIISLGTFVISLLSGGIKGISEALSNLNE